MKSDREMQSTGKCFSTPLYELLFRRISVINVVYVVLVVFGLHSLTTALSSKGVAKRIHKRTNDTVSTKDFVKRALRSTGHAPCSLRREDQSNLDIDCELLAHIVDSSVSSGSGRVGLSKLNVYDETIDVVILGGSVSCGHGSSEGYAKLLPDQLMLNGVNVTVRNFCTPASGPQLISNALKCGVEICTSSFRGIIIFEFSLNEWSVDKMERAFTLWEKTCEQATFVVLNLWAWAQLTYQEPETFRIAAPVSAAMKREFSIVDFTSATLPKWQKDSFVNIKEWYNCSLNWAPPTCLDTGPPLMHGNVVYHQTVALTLAFGIGRDAAAAVSWTSCSRDRRLMCC
jgi:hypothetical protein